MHYRTGLPHGRTGSHLLRSEVGAITVRMEPGVVARKTLQVGQHRKQTPECALGSQRRYCSNLHTPKYFVFP